MDPLLRALLLVLGLQKRCPAVVVGTSVPAI
jgi:hypothetical protein